jgi:hypothetical protein
MNKRLLICGVILCLLSCNFTREQHGQVLVNQQLIESNIQAVQPAENIDISIQTTNNHDSILIVKLKVSPKTPKDSLNGEQAKRVIASFITILPSMQTYTAYKVIFLKKDGAISTRSIEYLFPVTAELASRVTDYKDSTKTSMGYMAPGWTYMNKDLDFSVALNPGWYFVSDENDSTVFYPIGSDLNQLPQYRLDSDRKVTYLTLSHLDLGSDHTVLSISKKDSVLKKSAKGLPIYGGPIVTFGLVMNLFHTEDEYLQNLNETFNNKKLPSGQIKTYHFGNADFRGYQFTNPDGNGKMVHFLMVIKQFRRVTLIVRIIYSNAKEFEDVKQELSGVKILQVS